MSESFRGDAPIGPLATAAVLSPVLTRSFADNRLMLPGEQFVLPAAPAPEPAAYRVAGVTEVAPPAVKDDCAPPDKAKGKVAETAKPKPKVVKPASAFSSLVPKPSANFSEQVQAAKKRFVPPPKVAPVVAKDC